MHKQNFAESVEEICQADRRYDRDAYLFVREGLEFTLKALKKHTHATPAERHVSGQELLEGLRQYTLNEFGPMAKTVLEYWGIRRCEDFGEIVFNMVEHDVLRVTAQDSREDFRGGFDFDDAFVRPYRPARPAHRRGEARHVAAPDAARDPARSTDAKKLSGGSN